MLFPIIGFFRGQDFPLISCHGFETLKKRGYKSQLVLLGCIKYIAFDASVHLDKCQNYILDISIEPIKIWGPFDILFLRFTIECISHGFILNFFLKRTELMRAYLLFYISKSPSVIILVLVSLLTCFCPLQCTVGVSLCWNIAAL